MSPSPVEKQPVPILRALEMLFVTLARGCPESGPYWRTPPGGHTEVRWMEKAGTYRFTLDLMPPEPFPATTTAPKPSSPSPSGRVTDTRDE